MYKSQFKKWNNPYDWFCGPGSDIVNCVHGSWKQWFGLVYDNKDNKEPMTDSSRVQTLDLQNNGTHAKTQSC